MRGVSSERGRRKGRNCTVGENFSSLEEFRFEAYGIHKSCCGKIGSVPSLIAGRERLNALVR